MQGRRNGWELIGHDGNTGAPINRDTYRVVALRPDGPLVLPADARAPDRMRIAGPVDRIPASDAFSPGRIASGAFSN